MNFLKCSSLFFISFLLVGDNLLAADFCFRQKFSFNEALILFKKNADNLDCSNKKRMAEILNEQCLRTKEPAAFDHNLEVVLNFEAHAASLDESLNCRGCFCACDSQGSNHIAPFNVKIFKGKKIILCDTCTLDYCELKNSLVIKNISEPALPSWLVEFNSLTEQEKSLMKGDFLMAAQKLCQALLIRQQLNNNSSELTTENTHLKETVLLGSLYLFTQALFEAITFSVEPFTLNLPQL